MSISNADLTTASQRKVVIAYEEDGRTPLLDAAFIVAASWKVLLLAMMLGGLTGLGMSSLMERKYTVASQYLYSADTPGSGGLANLQARVGGLAALAGVDLGNSGSSRAEILAILRSESFISQFIERENLLPVLFVDQWNGESQSWKVQTPDVPSTGDGYIKFTENVLSVAEDKASGILRISMHWRDPQQAVDWTRSLVRQLNSTLRAEAMTRANASLAYLEKELSATSNLELRQALYGLIESAAQKKMLASVADDYAIREIAAPIAPDPDRYDSPKRIVSMILGALIAFVLTLVFISARRVLKSIR